MFKLVVLSAFLAVVAAKPGFLHGGLGYTALAAPAVAYAAPAVAIPAAVSHQSRVDVISKPVIATVAHAPVVATYTAHAPVVAAYAAPAVAYGGYGHGLGYGGLGYGYGHGW